MLQIQVAVLLLVLLVPELRLSVPLRLQVAMDLRLQVVVGPRQCLLLQDDVRLH